MFIIQTGLTNQILQIILQVIPFLILLLLHHFLLAPLFFRKKLAVYIPVTVVLLTAFGFYCYNAGKPSDLPMGRPGQQFQGPPPMMQDGSMPPPRPADDMRPPMDSGMAPPPGSMAPPPMEGMRPQMMPDGDRRPMRPETMKLLMALLLIGVDLGSMAYVRSLHSEKKVRHLEAENRMQLDRLEELSRNAENIRKAGSELSFKTDYKQVRIKPDNILYIEGMGEYLKIYHLDSVTPLVVLMSMKRLLEQLPDDSFARVHKSYIVNLKRVVNNSRTQITMENATVIPIGESYRVAVSDRLKARN